MQTVFEKIIEKLEMEQNKADEKCKDIVPLDRKGSISSRKVTKHRQGMGSVRPSC